MVKLLLLPLVLLLSQCNGANQTHQNQPEQMENQELPQQTKLNEAQEQQTPIEQGISGQVLWVSGNQMPSPDAPPSKGRGVQRTIHIYQLTNASQAKTTAGVFHTNIQTTLIAKVLTDANGHFAVNLEPGTYSLFTEEEKGLFASIFDGEMNINPVEVQQGQVTNIEIAVNYQAAY